MMYPKGRSPFVGWLRAVRLSLAIAVLPGAVWAAEQDAAVERRLADAAQYLSSDELEGRGIGTEGLDLAAQYIAAQFTQAGLKAELFAEGPFQTFQATAEVKIGDDNEFALVGPAPQQEAEAGRIELKLREDFTPMAMSGSGPLDLPLVFAGYGITGNEEGYDDYAGIDAAGKAVVILRHEPQQADPNSVFNGTSDSEHAPFRRKVSNAFEHGAAAVIFCSDEVQVRRAVAQARKGWQAAIDRLAEQHAEFKKIDHPTPEQLESQRKRIDELAEQVDARSQKLRDAYDPMLPFTAGGRDGLPRDFPVVFCRRAPLDRVVREALETDLATLERKIDQGPAPQSHLLTGWRVVGRVEVERTRCEVKNVLGVLEGAGPLADQTLVIGAHYDHIGWGGSGSRTGEKGEIRNGADDNASGVAVLLEVARTLARRNEKLRRRVVFIAFTAEERGLLGSRHYVGTPLFAMDKTIAMLNLDCVGRLRDNKLTAAGSGTASRLAELLDEANRSHAFELTKSPGGYGPSDHAAFYAEKVPVLHFFTGRHADLHRPSDDFEKLDIAGMRRIAGMVTELAIALANGDERPDYVATGRPRRGPSEGKRPFFGSIPDLSHTGPGYAIRGVSEGSPAQRAGLQGGDVIVRLGQSRIGNVDDFRSALGKHQGGDRVQVVVRRAGTERVFEVTLEPPR